MLAPHDAMSDSINSYGDGGPPPLGRAQWFLSTDADSSERAARGY